MSMAVDETGNDSLPLQIYDFRRRSCQLNDFLTLANSAKSSSPNSERFNDPELLVYRYDLAIDENRIGKSRRENICCRINRAGKQQDTLKNSQSPHFDRGHKTVPVELTEKRGQSMSATGSWTAMVSLIMQHYTL